MDPPEAWPQNPCNIWEDETTHPALSKHRITLNWQVINCSDLQAREMNETTLDPGIDTTTRQVV